MNKNIFRPFFNENSDVLNFIRYNTIGKKIKGNILTIPPQDLHLDK